MKFEGKFINEKGKTVNWWFEASDEEAFKRHLDEIGWKVLSLSEIRSNDIKRIVKRMGGDNRGIWISISLAILAIFLFVFHVYVFGVITLIVSFLFFMHDHSKALIAFFQSSKFYFRLEVRVNIKAILGHPIVKELFEKAKLSGAIEQEESWERWEQAFLTNYMKQIQKDDWMIPIRFDFKNDIVWKDTQFYPGDCLAHETDVSFSNLIESIILRMVNGVLKLQIKIMHSYKMWPIGVKTDDGRHLYKAYFTIASFPIIYFSALYHLPSKYLVPAYSADGPEEEKQSYREMAPDLWAYEILANEYPSQKTMRNEKSQWRQLWGVFIDKRDDWLKKEKFRDVMENNERYYECGGKWYRNEYLDIDLSGTEEGEEFSNMSDYEAWH